MKRNSGAPKQLQMKVGQFRGLSGSSGVSVVVLARDLSSPLFPSSKYTLFYILAGHANKAENDV